ncbi:MAG: MoaD/ThiS family protein [Caulobacteraceae bacterium]
MTKVLLFGRLSDIAGWRERSFDRAPATLFALKALLAQEDGELGKALDGKGVSAALDRVLVRGDRPLTHGSEVAFMPPMSGG